MQNNVKREILTVRFSKTHIVFCEFGQLYSDPEAGRLGCRQKLNDATDSHMDRRSFLTTGSVATGAIVSRAVLPALTYAVWGMHAGDPESQGHILNFAVGDCGVALSR
jgi:hypothetical protein